MTWPNLVTLGSKFREITKTYSFYSQIFLVKLNLDISLRKEKTIVLGIAYARKVVDFPNWAHVDITTL